jgi:hypothetical protein
LIDLNRIIVPPRAFQPWHRGRGMPAVKNVSEPCAGEPHARFDGGGRTRPVGCAARPSVAVGLRD